MEETDGQIFKTSLQTCEFSFFFFPSNSNAHVCVIFFKQPQKDDNFDPKVAEANLPVGKGNAANFDFSQIEYASKNDLFQS